MQHIEKIEQPTGSFSLEDLIRTQKQIRLTHYDPKKVRKAIWRSLAASNDPLVIERMCHELLEHSDRYLEISQAIATCPEWFLVPLVKAVDEHLQTGRKVSWQVLGKACKLLLQAKDLHDMRWLPLLEASLTSTSKHARMPAMSLVRRYCLEQYAPCVEEIAERTNSMDERQCALRILAEFALPSSKDVLSSFGHDYDTYCELDRPLTIAERAALEASFYTINENAYYLAYKLRRLETDALTELEMFVTRRCPNGGELVILSRAVGEYTKARIQEILPFLYHQDPFLRALVAWGFGMSGVRDAIEALVGLLRSEESPYVAYAIASSLKSNGGGNGVSMLLELVDEGGRWN